MRILHTSDWHIGKSINEYSLLEDQQYYIQQLIQVIQKEKIQVLIIAGDLYDRSVPSAEAVSLVNDILKKLIMEIQIPVLIISGNHDSRERLEFLKDLYEIANLYIEGTPKKEIKKVTLEDIYGEVHFYLLPYLDPYNGRVLFEDDSIKTYDDVYEASYQSIKKTMDASERNVLIAHGFFNWIDSDEDGYPLLQDTIFSESEISVGGSDLANIKRFADFDYIALGHLHSPQKAGKENIRYSGSILKYSISEAKQNKSVCIIDMKEKGNLQIEQREIPPLRNVRIVEGNFNDLLNRDMHKEENLEDYVFAHVTDTEMAVDGVNKLKSIYPNILGLQYTNIKQYTQTVVQDSKTIQSKSIMELYKDFYKSITGSLLDEEKQVIMKNIISEAERG